MTHMPQFPPVVVVSNDPNEPVHMPEETSNDHTDRILTYGTLLDVLW